MQEFPICRAPDMQEHPVCRAPDMQELPICRAPLVMAGAWTTEQEKMNNADATFSMS